MSAQGSGWFGSKRLGLGVGPRSWQGWVTTAVYIALMIGLPRVISPRTEHVRFLLSIIVLTTAFLAIAVWKRERPGG